MKRLIRGKSSRFYEKSDFSITNSLNVSHVHSAWRELSLRRSSRPSVVVRRRQMAAVSSRDQCRGRDSTRRQTVSLSRAQISLFLFHLVLLGRWRVNLEAGLQRMPVPPHLRSRWSLRSTSRPLRLIRFWTSSPIKRWLGRNLSRCPRSSSQQLSPSTNARFSTGALLWTPKVLLFLLRPLSPARWVSRWVGCVRMFRPNCCRSATWPNTWMLVRFTSSLTMILTILYHENSPCRLLE